MKALIKYIEITEKIRIAKWNRSDLSDENWMKMGNGIEMVRYIENDSMFQPSPSHPESSTNSVRITSSVKPTCHRPRQHV